MRHQALHDPLTGLPNRSLFLDRAAHALERASRTASASAVLFVDIDHFKLVNDSLGHEAGDTLLNALPARLEAVLRPADTIGRFGGDEFLVLLLDDFGRGYSSLSYLHRFPIDILKIDRSFTAALPDHEHAVEVVRAILAMADALRIDAVAEGVESEEQLTCLVELGCRAAQDDLFAMAMPGEQLPDLLGRSLVPGALRPG